MSLRAALQHLYHPATSTTAGRESRAQKREADISGSGGAAGENSIMKEYEEFVSNEYATQRESGKPGEVFQNRNEDHAKVVIPYLFKGAEQWVHLVTNAANTVVYGSPGVIDAALTFLREKKDGQVSILSETKLDRAEHPFFKATDAEPELRERVHLGFISESAQQDYGCNFGVNDRGDWRFEATRNTPEALVQFGGKDFAVELDHIFQDLSASTN